MSPWAGGGRPKKNSGAASRWHAANTCPIDKASYDLCLHLEQGVAGFSRQHRYGIGADMRAAARRVLRGVVLRGVVRGGVRANSAGNKAPELRELRLEIEELKV